MKIVQVDILDYSDDKDGEVIATLTLRKAGDKIEYSGKDPETGRYIVEQERETYRKFVEKYKEHPKLYADFPKMDDDVDIITNLYWYVTGSDIRATSPRIVEEK